MPKSSGLEFLEKFLENNFALSDAEGNTSWPLNRGGIADLPLLRTHLPKVPRAKFLGSDELFCCIRSSIQFGGISTFCHLEYFWTEG